MTEQEPQGDTADAETFTSRRHRITAGGRTFDYTAGAGTVIVRDDEHQPLASVFFTSYVADREEGSPPRPVTFLFNGGPGSASLWLNIGGFGPHRAPTRTPRATPPAPYESGDNPHTLLTASDLVFIDAPGTGYSRLLGDATPAQLWGVDQDVDAFAKAITRWLTLTNSWNAPRFLFGESYGTTRAASLVHRLQNQGLDFNGVVLLSTVLNWGESNLGGPREYVNLLPSFAATAWYHGRSRTGHAELEPFLAEAREFAQGPFAEALLRGDLLPAATENVVAERMSALIGLDADYLKKHHFRIGMEQYRYALLADEGRVIGRFDTRFTAEHQYVVGNGSHDPATDDAATAGVNSAHLSSYRAHLVDDIGYTSELHYRHLHNMPISRAWDWKHKAPGIDAPQLVPDVSLDLSAAVRRNPHLKVFVMGGYYDLATPFFGPELDVAQLYLAPSLRENIRMTFYESGHMTFVDEDAVERMKRDLDDFYRDATARR
ncbi:S10 family peptidase [Microbacterium sp. 179-I 3D4 NHS]|uniref:S10 family peptidase n=1 Tax=Microbacterium sp. 179-I 3D4 NHS TaxID=3142381 RepID=UPI0039A26884